MLNILYSSMLILILLSAQPVIASAQDDPSNDKDQDTQEIQNDEGYGKDDAEYYSSEIDNSATVEEVPNTSDDEAVKDEVGSDANDEDDAADAVPVDREQK